MLMRVLTDLFSRYEDERRAAAFTRRFLDHLKPPADELEPVSASAFISATATATSPFFAPSSPTAAWPSPPRASVPPRPAPSSAPTWVDADSMFASSSRMTPPRDPAPTRAALASFPAPAPALPSVPASEANQVSSSSSNQIRLGSSVPSESDSEFELPASSLRFPNSSWALRNDSGSDFLIIISGRDSRGLLRVSRDFAAIPEVGLHAMASLGA